MLIKVQSHLGSNDYYIYDRVSQICYAEYPHYIYNAKELAEFSPDSSREIRLWLVQERIISALPLRDACTPPFAFEGEALRLNVIHYIDENGTPICLVFDGVAYICNDEGKTVHKVKAAGPVIGATLQSAAETKTDAPSA